MKVQIFKAVQDFLKQDFNTSISAGYICLVVIGMLFQAFLYLLFNINIVQYSDISDFLLAPFRDPKILIFTGISVFLIFCFTIFDNWLSDVFPRFYDLMFMGIDRTKYEAWYSIKGATLVIVAYIMLAAYFYGVWESEAIRKTMDSKTQLTFKDNKFEATDTLIYIGKTNGYVFLYNRTKKQTDVVPMNDVLKIEVNK
jgi:hypothetical protein